MLKAEKQVLDRLFVRFAIAVAVVGAALLLRQAMERHFGIELPPFITFYPAIMTVAVLAGLWPGLLATVLASLVVDYWIFPPRGSFTIASTQDAIALIFFSGMGVFMSVMAEIYRRNQRRIVAYQREEVRRENEDKLRKSEEQFETLANAIPQLCWMANPDGFIFWYNQRWYGYTGTTPADMEGWGWQSVHDPETLPKVLEQWERSIATGEPFDMVFPLRGGDGVFRPFLTRVMPVKDAEGKVVRWFGTNTDISEQMKAEEDSKNSFATLSNFVPQIVWMCTPDGLNVYFNQRWVDYTGLTLEESHGRGWNRPFHPDDQQPAWDAWNRAVQSDGEHPYSVECRLRAADGSYRRFLIRGEPMRNSSGEIHRWFGTCTDIEDLKQESEARYRELVQSANSAIIRWSCDGTITFFNEFAQRFFDWNADEVVGKHISLLVPERESTGTDLTGLVEDIVAHPERYLNQTNENVCRDGRRVWMTWSNRAVRDEHGKVTEILAVGSDITDRKRAEETNARLAAIIETSGDAIISKNLDGMVLSWNQSAERLLGYSAEEIIGQPITLIIPPDCDDEEPAFLERLRQGGDIDHYETVRIDKSGRRIDVSVTLSPIRDASGAAIGISKSIRDITERKRAESVLEATLRRFYLILSNMYSGIMLVTDAGRVEFVNQAFCDQFGMEGSPGELVGGEPAVTIEKIRNAYRRPAEAVARIQKLLDGWKPARGEEITMASGKTLLRDFIPLNADGASYGRLWIHTDISERKRAEIESRAREQRLRLATDAAQLGIFEWTVPTDTAVWENNRMYEIFGIPENTDPMNRDRFVRETLHPEDLPRFSRELEESMRPGTLFRGAYRIRRMNDGQWRWIQYFSKFALTPDGKPLRLLGVLEDITERKRTELEREVSVEFLRLVNASTGTREMVSAAVTFLQEQSGCEAVGIRLQDGDDYPYYEARGFPTEFVLLENSLCVRNAAGEILRDSSGYPINECMCGSVICGRFDPSKPFFTAGGSFWTNTTTQLLASTTAAERQSRTRNRCHGEGYESVALIPLLVGQEHLGLLQLNDRRAGMFSAEMIALWERLAGYLAVALAKSRAQESLRSSEQRWATTLGSIGDAVISTDASGNVVFMNEVAQKLTGWPLAEARGRALEAVFDIVHESTRIKPENPVAKVIRLGRVVGLANHTVLIGRDGSETPIDDSAAPIRDSDGRIEGVVLVFHDVSEQRRAEKAVRDSDRLATTGRLAATIAHEIHNPLDAVSNLLYLIDQGTKEESTREFASLASQELARITQLTRQMLTFQREAAKPVPVKIEQILENVIALYERKIRTAGINLELQVEFDDEIMALPGELRQMFANLIGNAIEAMGSRRGTITLRAYSSQDWRLDRPGLRVVVADDGPGIPPEVRAKIFEPFFTTKGESGTGLGLWIASDILRKYDGTLRLKSRTHPNSSGTCFSVFLPIESDGDC